MLQLFTCDVFVDTEIMTSLHHVIGETCCLDDTYFILIFLNHDV